MLKSLREKTAVLDFYGQAEEMVVEYSNSVLIDAELSQYRNSLIIFGLYSVVLEI